MALAPHMMWFRSPALYFGYATTTEALRDLPGCHITRVFILTDRTVHNCGFTKDLVEKLDELGIDRELFCDVTTATTEMVEIVSKAMAVYAPDCIIAIGGGSVLDVAKVCRIIHDPSNPHHSLDELYAYDHMQLLTESETPTGVNRLPKCDIHIKKLICIPTTSATGSEMTPIAWVIQKPTDSEGLTLKRPIVSWRMTPDVAIVDGFYTQSLTQQMAASGGMQTLLCALESAVSRLTSDYTIAFSNKAARLILQELENSAINKHQQSRIHCHNAASIAGLAFGNAFVGIGCALSIVLQSFIAKTVQKNVHQGNTCGAVISQVIRFNANRSPEAAKAYGVIADEFSEEPRKLQTDLEKVNFLVNAIEKLKEKIKLPKNLRALISDEKEFENNLDILATETLKVVGCASTNPVEMTNKDVKELLREAYKGE